MDVFTLAAKLTLDTGEFSTDLANAEAQAKGFGKSKVWSTIGKVAAGATVAAGTAVVKAIKSSVETGMQFDAMMSEVQAVSQATGNEFDILRARAQELGLSHTYFVTPSGLEGEGHGSSASDMALLAREALKSPIFREICSQESMKVTFGDPPYDRWLKNTNKLLSLCGGTYGVKTGFTDEAGRCLVSACRRDGKDLICVTLNDSDDWNDHMALYDYAFQKARLIKPEPGEFSVTVVGGEAGEVKCAPEELPQLTALDAQPGELEYRLISAPFVYAPVMAGDKTAQLSISRNGREITRIPLLAQEDVPATVPEPVKKGIWQRIRSFFRGIF